MYDIQYEKKMFILKFAKDYILTVLLNWVSKDEL